MFLLENSNRTVADVVKALINADSKKKCKGYDSRLYDFDNSCFSVEQDTDRSLTISLALPCYNEIKDHGSYEALVKEFGEYLQEVPQEGYDVTVKYPTDSWVGKEEETIEKISKLKFIALGGVFRRYLEAVSNGTIDSLPQFKFALRDDTIVYLAPFNKNVCVIYQLSFIDKGDVEIGRSFLSSFADPAIRRKIQRAPVVSFDIEPTEMLKSMGVTRNTGEIGFVTFTLSPTHCEEHARDKAVGCLQVFRNFVQYHIKCAKSYFNSRMRARVVDFVKVLNRAKLIEETKRTLVTTAGGRVVVNRR